MSFTTLYSYSTIVLIWVIELNKVISVFSIFVYAVLFCVIIFKVDGSTLLWDLSDNAQGSLDGSLSLKVPTYSTG